MNTIGLTEKLPSWEELKNATIETYGFKLPNTTTYWVPLHNPKNTLLSWDDFTSIFKKIYSDIQITTEKMIFQIYTPESHTIEIFNTAVSHCQVAWVHDSYCQTRTLFKTARDWDPSNIQDCIPIQPNSYERIEWLGDRTIQSIMGNYLSWRFPDCQEGFLTKANSKLVRTGCLGTCAKWIGFSKFLILSRFHDDFLHSRDDLRILEDSFEAFIGCLSQTTNKKYGTLVVTDFVFRLLEHIIDIPSFLNTDENYKDLLMQYYHKSHNGSFPTYSEQGVEESVQDGQTKRMTRMAVHDPNGAILKTALGISKKEAEQNAAKLACIHYGIDFFDGGMPFYLSPIAT